MAVMEKRTFCNDSAIIEKYSKIDQYVSNMTSLRARNRSGYSMDLFY